MKTNLTLTVLFAMMLFNGIAQNFIWKNGHNYNGVVPGVYGMQGVASSTTYPGHRHGCATWVDNSGNLWLFGGEGVSATSTVSWLSDLWKYSPTTNQWTWVRGSNAPNQPSIYGTQGVPANANQPGAREFMGFWTDASGNFWMYGGDGFDGTSTFGRLGDLWKYNPSTNQWTWMKGFNTVDQAGVYGTMGTTSSTNLPGSRLAPGCWMDASGNFWMFGGKGYDASSLDGNLCDLWKYSPSTNNWTWMHGSNANSQSGIFGTLGTASVSFNPGGREHPGTWIDASGNLYLFGGRGFGSLSNMGYLNDMWKYNPSNNTWAWVSGSNTVNALGVYGTQAVTNSSNVPGGRYAMGMWTDAGGDFWMFGGLGWIGTASLANINDLWKYNPLTNQWTWMKGSNTINAAGVYGTVGVASPNDFPGARHFNNTWRNLTSQLWLFGGEGIDNNNQNPQDNMNDLWGYVPPCNPDSILSNQYNLCSGNSLSLTAYNQYTANVTWFNSASGGNSLGTGSVLTVNNLTASNSPSVYTYYAQSNNCTLTPRALVNVTVNPLPIISISGATACAGSTATLTASGAGSYTWANGVTTNTVVVNPVNGFSYSVIGSSLGCSNTAAVNATVFNAPTVVINGTNQVCSGTTVSLLASGANTYTWMNGATNASLAISPTINSTYSVMANDNNGCLGTASINVTVLALPTLSATTTKTLCCVQDPNTLHASGAISYTWTNNATGSTLIVPPYSYTSNSTVVFTVSGSNSLACVGSASVMVKFIGCVGYQEYNGYEHQLLIYPNPSMGSFNFKNESGLENLSLEIYNGLGQLVFITELNKNNVEINSRLANGIYYYTIKQNTEALKTGKLLIE